MLKTSVFKIQVNCPACNTLHAVSGINDFENCRKCGKGIALSSLFDDILFGNVVNKEKYMNAFLSGNVEQFGGGGVGKTGSYKLTYSSGHLYCEECLSPIEENEVYNAIAEKRPVKCAKCSHKMPLRLPTAGMKRFHPRSIAVINDPQGFDAGERDTSSEKMLVFSCMTCGAGLNLTDKTERTLKCTFCGNDNYLPDAIWIKLHPDEDVQPFFVITDISEGDIKDSLDYLLSVTVLRVYQKHVDNFILEMFQNLKMTDALRAWIKIFLNAEYTDKIGANMDITKSQKFFYEQLALGLDSQDTALKETAARYGKTIPHDLQKKLAADKNESVRLALAQNGSLEKDVYKILKNDGNASVASEAGKHKSGFLSKIFN